MSISELIAPQLPYLRRFARVLSGSQASGDAYVVAMLEAIAAEPKLFPTEIEPRVATYRTFLKVWNSVRLNHKTVDAATSERLAAADRKLEADHAERAAGVPAHGSRGVHHRRHRADSRDRRGGRQSARRPGGVRDRRASGDQRAHHRGRADDRHRSCRSRHRPRPRRLRDGPHPQGGGGQPSAGTSRASSSPTSSSPTAAPAWTRSTRSSGSFDVPVIFITAYPERLLTGSASGADLPRQQAVPHRDRAGRHQPGAVLRLQGPARRSPRPRTSPQTKRPASL